MNILGSVIFAAAISMDAFGIGFSCSLRGIRFPLRCKLLICGWVVAVTAVAVIAGGIISGFLPEWAGSIIGAVMLIMLGIYIFAGALIRHKKESSEKIKPSDILIKPEVCDMDKSSDVDMKEALYTGIALSLDSFSAGLGAGVAGGADLIPLLSGLFHFILLFVGEFCGRFMKNRFSGGELWLTLLSSLLLIIIGVFGLF